MKKTIAIDGPVGAGKSTVAKAVSERLGMHYLDTGAMYRTVGLAAVRRGIDPHDEAAVTAMCGQIDVSVRYEEDGQHTLLDGEDVRGLIRAPQIGDAASAVGKHAAVRRKLVASQQRIAELYDLVMDGRDIGTVVLPHATLKLFLTAAPEIRARRRYDEQQAKGITDSFEKVLADLLARDEQDTHRAVDPLRAADDAVIFDSGALDFAQTVDAIVAMARERGI